MSRGIFGLSVLLDEALDVVAFAVAGVGCRREEPWAGLVLGKGFGALNLVRSLETLLLLLGCLLCVGLKEDPDAGVGFLLLEISRAAICRVTEPTEAIVGKS